MQKRSEPRIVRKGWPFMSARTSAGTFGLCIHGGPRERGELRAWVITTNARAWDAVTAAEQVPEGGTVDLDAVQAATLASLGTIEGTTGWLLAWAWHDETRDLDAKLAYDRGEFQGPTARLDCGAAVVAELLDAGWSWEDVQDVAKDVLALLANGRPDGQEVAEVRPFCPETTSPTS